VRDWRNRPISDFPVVLDAGGRTEQRRTDARGVAVADVVLPDGDGPVVFRARGGDRIRRALTTRGAPATLLSEHDLSAEQLITLRAGRVSGLSVEVEPNPLRAAPGKVAYVTVTVEDSAGAPITDVRPDLSASEGTFEATRLRPDGRWQAAYLPDTVERPRQIEVTATVESLRSTARLEVEPRPMRLTLAPWVGGIANFGKVAAPILGIEGDVTVLNPIGERQLMLRLGASRYAFSDSAGTGLGQQATVDMVVYPLQSAALVRWNQGRLGTWAGAGLAVTLQAIELSFGSVVVDQGMRVTAGPLATGGAGWRLAGGEMFGNATALWVPVSGGEGGFSGNIGGLAIGGGYRLVF
jgi:hypothetical protein